MLGCLAKEEPDFLEGLCESVFGSHGRLYPRRALELPTISSIGRKARYVKLDRLDRLGRWTARRCEVKDVLTKFGG